MCLDYSVYLNNLIFGLRIILMLETDKNQNDIGVSNPRVPYWLVGRNRHLQTRFILLWTEMNHATETFFSLQ